MQDVIPLRFRPSEPRPFPPTFMLSTNHLRASGVDEGQIAQLTAEDVVMISQTVQRHLWQDVFPGEVTEAVELLIEAKRRTPGLRRDETGYGFRGREKLVEHLSHDRFMDLMLRDDTHIHDVHVSENSYGEFLFVTAARPVKDVPQRLTFFGLGYHVHRDRWMDDNWFWYEPSTDAASKAIEKVEFEQIIAQRRHEVLIDSRGHQQSKRGQVFEFIADLTDDDGALAELEDNEDWERLDNEE